MSKFKVGQVWKRRDGVEGTVTVHDAEDAKYPWKAGDDWYTGEGMYFYRGGSHSFDLVELVKDVGEAEGPTDQTTHLHLAATAAWVEDCNKAAPQGHPHAESMRLFAEDAEWHPKPWELWQYRTPVDDWRKCTVSPGWEAVFDYQRIPQTIRIGDVDVPRPMTIEEYRAHVETGQRAWVAVPHSRELAWETINTVAYVRRNLVHATKEAAAQHAKALIKISGGNYE